MNNSLVNELTLSLKPYPMEALTRIKVQLNKDKIRVFDFGTGDPRIPCWSKLNDKLKESVAAISQYPTARGSTKLIEAQQGYLERRFGVKTSPDLLIAATRGSKEAIFNVSFSIVGRAGGKKTIIYPDPGYPVYYSSTVFARGTPYPVALSAEHQYLLKPWLLPDSVQNDAAAIWVNYPHNPTGKTADLEYWKELISWAHKKDCLILSDDCYVDIYDSKLDDFKNQKSMKDQRPICPLGLTQDRVLSFFSLSKRSGLTGYRSGFIAGDARFMKPHLEARANMGVGTPSFIEEASALAWSDDDHVSERRKIFTQRIDAAAPALIELGLLDRPPEAAFYLWCKIPAKYGKNDVEFCLDLAKKGIITSPSKWLSHSVHGYFRLALVPDLEETQEAISMISSFVRD